MKKTTPIAVYFNPRVSSVKDFITAIQLTKNGFKDIVVLNNFLENWIQKEDIDYLVNLLDSEVECKNLKNPLSSHISKQTALLGDYVYWLINSYITKTKLDIGLNFIPKSCSPQEKENLIEIIKNQVN